jgi:hypothetical protein
LVGEDQDADPDAASVLVCVLVLVLGLGLAAFCPAVVLLVDSAQTGAGSGRLAATTFFSS